MSAGRLLEEWSKAVEYSRRRSPAAVSVLLTGTSGLCPRRGPTPRAPLRHIFSAFTVRAHLRPELGQLRNYPRSHLPRGQGGHAEWPISARGGSLPSSHCSRPEIERGLCESGRCV